jgi:2'-5' RNA ligase
VTKGGTEPTAGTQRVFFAMWPDAPAMLALAELAQRVATAAEGRATPQERLHLTLAFVGETAQERISELVRIGRDVARSAAPFTLQLDRVGFFRNAGIAWIGCDEAPEPLLGLVRDLQAGLTAAAFPVDARPYRAHLSLARKCRVRPGRVELEPLAWQAAAMTLHASKLSNTGPAYTGIAQWALGAA